MKALLLQLDYVGRGFVGVLQSSRYVEGGGGSAELAAHHDAAHLRQAGLDVIREKVEAVAATCSGVPQSRADVLAPTDRSFEFHLLVDRKSGGLTDDDHRALHTLATQLTAQLGTLVPLSYNALKPSGRFLNLRARGVGLAEAMASMRRLEAAVAELLDLEVKKVIAEYVCFDSNRAVDNGWLEPLP